MTPVNTVTENDFAILRDYIERQCGIALAHDKAYLVETRLANLMAETGCENFGDFGRLAQSPNYSVQ